MTVAAGVRGARKRRRQCGGTERGSCSDVTNIRLAGTTQHHTGSSTAGGSGRGRGSGSTRVKGGTRVATGTNAKTDAIDGVGEPKHRCVASWLSAQGHSDVIT